MKHCISVVILVLVVYATAIGQSAFDGIYLEGINSTLQNSTVTYRNTFYTPSEPDYYVETGTLGIDSTGKWWLNVGEGMVSVSSYLSDFQQIDFSIDSISLMVEFDDGSGYIIISDEFFGRLPYAYYSLHSSDALGMADMDDVDTTGSEIGHIVVFNAGIWSPEYSSGQHADSANFSMWSDTANHSWTSQNISVDTSVFSFISDTVNYSDTSAFAHFADSSSGAIYAGYTVYDPAWKLTGNADGGFIGTNQDTLILSANSNNLVIRTSGISLGPKLGNADISGYVSDGLRFVNTRNLGIFPTYQDTGVYFVFNANRSSLLIGTAVDSLWGTTNVGNFNFGHGKGHRMAGDYNLLFGENHYAEDAVARYNFLTGKGHVTSGFYGIMAGRNCEIKSNRSITMGDSCRAPYGYACVAMGRNSTAHGNIEPAVAIGHNILNTGKWTSAWGYKVHVNGRQGCFIYADRSTEDTLKFAATPGNYNFFRVRAAGGTEFFSDAASSIGVTLAPGSGAWSTTSNQYLKNLRDANIDYDKLDELNVYTWNYETQESHLKHLGPMSQDFYSLYELGETDRRISMVDIDGFIFSGVKHIRNDLNAIDSAVIEKKVDHLNSEYRSLNERLDNILKESENE